MFQSFLSAQEMFRARPLRYLFVLGHVRSGSSLLVHILNSHPEICAVGESWLLYDGEATFRKLVPFVHATLRKPFLTETYVVDKISTTSYSTSRSCSACRGCPPSSSFVIRNEASSACMLIAYA